MIAPQELMQTLIRLDTTNPPGNEILCIQYIDSLLNEAGISTTILARDPNRPNLIARLTGRGDAPPLLLYGHVDVVTTVDQEWTYPPFEAREVDGFIWGCGTLDMKGPLTMLIAAFLKAARIDLPGDVILCVVSDEEAGGNYGARFLVEQHPEQFDGVRFALGEFGGFTLYFNGGRFYPIMIGEKLSCATRATLRGTGGHAAFPVRGSAMGDLGRVLDVLDRKRLPVHVTPYTRIMLEALAAELSFPANAMMRGLLNPMLTDRILDLLGESGMLFDNLLHNTVSPTMVRASEVINVIPGVVEVGLDIRLLPGFKPDDAYREIRALLPKGLDIEFEVVEHAPGPDKPDMGLYNTLADIMRNADPEGVPVPYMVGGVTDARFFSQLGIQTYGFTPMQLPPDVNLARAIHAADERIPVGAVEFGTERVFEALQRFGEANAC
ncbi:MAG: M20/M25/M40 family metallo-hydrolase [Anaerolineae bacterium]